MNDVVDDLAAVLALLRPFLEWDLQSWKGLPRLSVENLNAALGKPSVREETKLGWYAADRYVYELAVPSGGLAAYVRNHEAVLLEALIPPPFSAMNGLGEPSAIKPHEVLAQNAYVHEYLYCNRGLVLSIAEPFQKEQPLQIVRCRGIRAMNSPEEFGPELYQAFEDKIVW